LFIGCLPCRDYLNQVSEWWVTLNPRGWWNYDRAIGRGSRQGKIVEANQIPGLALLDANANAVWVHRGKGLGDYPALDDVLEDLRNPHPESPP
jgi:hypothetical protein